MKDQKNVGSIPFDPVEFIANVEAAWQAKDPVASAADYAEDAVQYYGNGQRRDGRMLREWPGRWFSYATDLKIRKQYRAHSGNCIASTWESEYTSPETGKKMFERGSEIFYINPDGKIYEHHMWQHSWQDGQKGSDGEVVL